MDHISYLFCLFIPFSYYCHCVDETDSFPSISFTEKVSTGQTLIQSLFTYTLGSYIGLWLILSLVLMIACFINSSGASISAGIVFILLRQSYLVSLLHSSKMGVDQMESDQYVESAKPNWKRRDHEAIDSSFY